MKKIYDKDDLNYDFILSRYSWKKMFKYNNQGTTYHNKEYLLEIVGYIIKEDDIKEFEKEYPDVEYFSTKNLSNSNFNDRVPIYSLVEYDSSKYLAVLFDSSLYSIYKTEEAEEINLTNIQL